MESEFVALDKVVKEAEFLRNFLEDILMWKKHLSAIQIPCYSQSIIAYAHSNLYNGKSHHIRRRHKTIRQLISNVEIIIDYIKSDDKLEDPLSWDIVAESSKGMSLKPMTNEDAWWQSYLPWLEIPRYKSKGKEKSNKIYWQHFETIISSELLRL